MPSFMEANDIPNNAYFDGYDGWVSGDIRLCWEFDVPTTDKDKLNFRQKRFTTIAWKFVYDLLVENGFKRVGFSSSLLKEFDGITVYDMYLNNDFDMLVKYYSLSFKKDK